MNVTVRFFGPARDWAGRESTTLSLEPGRTVGDVAGLLAGQHPALGAALGIRLCVNRAYVPLSTALKDGDEIAVIPPVSGG
jgi:molybdopterin converting factor subunit 1